MGELSIRAGVYGAGIDCKSVLDARDGGQAAEGDTGCGATPTPCSLRGRPAGERSVG